VKKFTRQTVKDLKGPVTVVMGKKRRVTFIECPNDLNSMIVRLALMTCSGSLSPPLLPPCLFWIPFPPLFFLPACSEAGDCEGVGPLPVAGVSLPSDVFG
jgi:hypothetical protein